MKTSALHRLRIGRVGCILKTYWSEYMEWSARAQGGCGIAQSRRTGGTAQGSGQSGGGGTRRGCSHSRSGGHSVKITQTRSDMKLLASRKWMINL